MKSDDFAFDQEFRDNLAGASAQQTAEGGSWKDYGIALAKEAVIFGVALPISLVSSLLGGSGSTGYQFARALFDDPSDASPTPTAKPVSSSLKPH